MVLAIGSTPLCRKNLSQIVADLSSARYTFGGERPPRGQIAHNPPLARSARLERSRTCGSALHRRIPGPARSRCGAHGEAVICSSTPPPAA